MSLSSVASISTPWGTGYQMGPGALPQSVASAPDNGSNTQPTGSNGPIRPSTYGPDAYAQLGSQPANGKADPKSILGLSPTQFMLAAITTTVAGVAVVCAVIGGRRGGFLRRVRPAEAAPAQPHNAEFDKAETRGATRKEQTRSDRSAAPVGDFEAFNVDPPEMPRDLDLADLAHDTPMQPDPAHFIGLNGHHHNLDHHGQPDIYDQLHAEPGIYGQYAQLNADQGLYGGLGQLYADPGIYGNVGDAGGGISDLNYDHVAGVG